MSEMKTISANISHGGVQGVYAHESTSCNCEMTFSVFIPPKAQTTPCPVLWYLSGLTCTHANVMEKGEYRAMAAEKGVIIVCPDTSPRGADVPDEPDNWQFGQGAGFYVDATQEPFLRNYQMYTYITQELPELIEKSFNADMSRQSIFGHSMGGHGALTIALKNPDVYKSCSAFAPICEPSAADWSTYAFEKYLGSDEKNWLEYDASKLLENGKRFSPILCDQGGADAFMDGLRPDALKDAASNSNIDFRSRIQPGYDHSYFFISSFMSEHVAWHAQYLK